MERKETALEIVSGMIADVDNRLHTFEFGEDDSRHQEYSSLVRLERRLYELKETMQQEKVDVPIPVPQPQLEVDYDGS